MKTHLLLAVPITFLIGSCSRQTISRDRVPSVVKNTLSAKYSHVKDVQWEKHGHTYEAEFDVNDTVEVTAKIDETGKLLMEKEDVSSSELTREISTVLQDLYKNYTINNAEKVLTNGKVYYQLELNGKGEKDRHLVFSPLGKEEKHTPYWD